MPGKINISSGSALSFRGCLNDLCGALNLTNVVAFRDADGEYVFGEYNELPEEELVRIFCPRDGQAKVITEALIHFAATGEPGDLNRVYSLLDSVGDLSNYSNAMKSCLEDNLRTGFLAGIFMYSGGELPDSLSELTEFRKNNPPLQRTSLKNIKRLNQLFSGKYAQLAKSFCPANDGIVLDETNEDHERAGAVALLLIVLGALVSDERWSGFTDSLKRWIKDTFFSSDDGWITTYTEYSTGSSAAINSLIGQLITVNNSVEFGLYDLENELDLDLNELDSLKEHSNTQKLERHPAKSRRPQNEGDDIR